MSAELRSSFTGMVHTEPGGTTPITKNSAGKSVPEGGSPIEKNVRVTDMHGNEREPTWPKRAEGLVKKGRAYRLAEDHICLIGETESSDRQTGHAETSEYNTHQTVCSSDIQTKISEESHMNVQENGKMEAVSDEISAETSRGWGKLTMNYVLDKIESVRKDTEYLHRTIDALNAMMVGQGPEDIAGQAKAQALADVVRCRETTNQQLIQLYTGMYEDLKPADACCDAPNTRQEALKMVERIIVNVSDTDAIPAILESMQNFCDTLRFI